MFWDIGVSTLVTIGLSQSFGVPFTIGFWLLNIFFGLLPDIDTPIELLQRGRIGGKVQGFHGSYTHYPMLWVPVFGLAYLLLPLIVFLALVTNVTAHLLHDIMPFSTGWGMKILWPFSQKRYKLLTTKEGRFTMNKAYTAWGDDLDTTIEKHGNENWIRDLYLHPSPILIIELLMLLVGILVLIAVLR